MTFENALKRIQAKFAEVDGAKLADMAVQVTLTDEDCGGILYFKVTDGAIDVRGYDYRDNDAAIEISRKALMDLLGGKTTLDKAVEKGQATAVGSFEKLDTLKDAIPKYVAPSRRKAEPAPAEAAPVKKCGRKCASKNSGTKKTTKTKA